MAVKCPKCGSSNVQFSSSTYKNGPSFLKGLCGFLFMGPFGILCSLCGIKTQTHEFWVCTNCGAKFQHGDYQRAMQIKQKKMNKLYSQTEAIKRNLESKEIPENLDQLHRQAEMTKNSQKEYLKNEKTRIINSNEQLKKMETLRIIAIAASAGMFLLGVLLTKSTVFGYILTAMGAFAGAGSYMFFKNQFESLLTPSEKSYISQLEMQYKQGKKNFDELTKLKKDLDSLNKKSQELHSIRSEIENMENRG